MGEDKVRITVQRGENSADVAVRVTEARPVGTTQLFRLPVRKRRIVKRELCGDARPLVCCGRAGIDLRTEIRVLAAQRVLTIMRSALESPAIKLKKESDRRFIDCL